MLYRAKIWIWPSMGRKAREERQEKREGYAAARSRKQRKTNLMELGIQN